MRLTFIHVLTVSLFIPAGCGNSPTIVKSRQTAPESPAQNHIIAPHPPAESKAFASALKRAESAFQSGQLDQAARLFDSLLATNPQMPEPYYFLAMIDMANENWTAAKERLLAALDRAPEDSESRGRIYANLGRVWEGLGNIGQAKLNYMMAVNLDPASEIAAAGLERLE